MSKKRWKDVVGYEGLYQISDCGDIKSLHKTRGTYGRILKIRKRGEDGYLGVVLCRDGERKDFLIHRLVLLAFNGPCPIGMETRHINGNGTDNRINNLSWGTHSENMKDQVRHGTYIYARGSQSTRAILNEENIGQIRELLISGRDGHFGKKYSQLTIAKMFNVSEQTICAIKKRRRWGWLK